MKTLITAVGRYTTGDAIAEAFLAYWLELSKERMSDVVSVPYLTPEEEHRSVMLTVGWGTQFAAIDAETAAELIDDIAVKDLTRRAENLHLKATHFSPQEFDEVLEHDIF